MNDIPLAAFTQFGGLGILALFAYIMLRSMLRQQEKLGELLSNHLTSLLQRQELTNQLLKQLVDVMQHHDVEAGERQKEILKEIRREGD